MNVLVGRLLSPIWSKFRSAFKVSQKNLGRKDVNGDQVSETDENKAIPTYQPKVIALAIDSRVAQVELVVNRNNPAPALRKCTYRGCSLLTPQRRGS